MIPIRHRRWFQWRRKLAPPSRLGETEETTGCGTCFNGATLVIAMISQVVAGDRIGCTGAVRLWDSWFFFIWAISFSKTTNINSEIRIVEDPKHFWSSDSPDMPRSAAKMRIWRFDAGKLVGLAGPEAVVQIGGSAGGLRSWYDSCNWSDAQRFVTGAKFPLISWCLRLPMPNELVDLVPEARRS